jgi:membrane protease YdiL (CAAX protease family)
MYLFVRDVDDGAGFVLYDLALFVGAVGAAYAVKQFVDATWRDLGQCLLTAGLIGTLAALDMYANVSTAHPFASPFDAPALRDFFVSLGTYIAAVFVVEEVWFRGALDSYIHHPGENHGIFLSIYWRRAGNLAVPGFTHAFSDAVRNILVGVP